MPHDAGFRWTPISIHFLFSKAEREEANSKSIPKTKEQVVSSKTVRTKPCFCDSFLAGISRAGGTVGYKALHGITMHYSVPYTKHFQDGKVLASWSIVMQAYGVDMQARDCQWTCEKRIADEIWTPQVHPKSSWLTWQHYDNTMTTIHHPSLHHCIFMFGSVRSSCPTLTGVRFFLGNST